MNKISHAGFSLLDVADAWWARYQQTGNTDHYCTARKAERGGLVTLAHANGSLVGMFSDWFPGSTLGERAAQEQGP